MLLSAGGMVRPLDLRIWTSLTCLASLCTLGKGGTDFFVLPQPRHWHWNITFSSEMKKSKFFSVTILSNSIFNKNCNLQPPTTTEIGKCGLHVTRLFCDAMINTVCHILELKVTRVPATFENVILSWNRRRITTLYLANLFVHLDGLFFPRLFLTRRQFSPLKITTNNLKNLSCLWHMNKLNCYYHLCFFSVATPSFLFLPFFQFPTQISMKSILLFLKNSCSKWNISTISKFLLKHIILNTLHVCKYNIYYHYY